MVFSWVRKGLRTGVLTTRYPEVHEQMPEGFRGRPALDAHRCLSEQGCDACVQICLPSALELKEAISGSDDETGNRSLHLTLDYARCIMCGLCVPACPTGALRMTGDYELAARQREDLRIINVLERAPGSKRVTGKEKNDGRPA
jgi:hydrogenase-4 component H